MLRILKYIAIGIMGIVVTYALVCSICSLILYMYSPVVHEDFISASWHESYVAHSWLNSTATISMALTLIALGLIQSLQSSKIAAVVLSSAVALGMSIATTEAVVVETGIYYDYLRVGCYVWDAEACHKMQGVPGGDSNLNKWVNSEYNPNYAVAIAKVKPNSIANKHSQGLPVSSGSFMSAPIVFMHREEIRQELFKQREVLQAWKNKYYFEDMVLKQEHKHLRK